MSVYSELLMEKAKLVHEHVKYEPKKNGKVEIDPLTIMAVASLIINLIRLYIECKRNAKDVEKSLKNPSLFDKIALRRQVRKLAKRNTSIEIGLEEGFSNLKNHLTLNEIEQLMAEA